MNRSVIPLPPGVSNLTVCLTVGGTKDRSLKVIMGSLTPKRRGRGVLCVSLLVTGSKGVPQEARFEIYFRIQLLEGILLLHFQDKKGEKNIGVFVLFLEVCRVSL